MLKEFDGIVSLNFFCNNFSVPSTANVWKCCLMNFGLVYGLGVQEPRCDDKRLSRLTAQVLAIGCTCQYLLKLANNYCTSRLLRFHTASDNFLVKFTHLTSLMLADSRITDEGLRRMTNLTSLDLWTESPVTGEVLVLLTKLERLRLFKDFPQGFDQISCLVNLRSLYTHISFDPASLVPLKNLRSLSVFSDEIANEDNFSLLTQLNKLWIPFGFPLTCTTLTNLTSLRMQTEDLSRVESLPKLEHLRIAPNFSGMNLTLPDSLTHLKGLYLESVFSLENLKNMKNIERLSIPDWSNWELLTGLTNLRRISSNCGKPSADLFSCLTRLNNVYGTFTPESVAALPPTIQILNVVSGDTGSISHLTNLTSLCVPTLHSPHDLEHLTNLTFLQIRKQEKPCELSFLTNLTVLYVKFSVSNEQISSLVKLVELGCSNLDHYTLELK